MNFKTVLLSVLFTAVCSLMVIGYNSSSIKALQDYNIEALTDGDETSVSIEFEPCVNPGDATGQGFDHFGSGSTISICEPYDPNALRIDGCVPCGSYGSQAFNSQVYSCWYIEIVASRG